MKTVSGEDMDNEGEDDHCLQTVLKIWTRTMTMKTVVKIWIKEKITTTLCRLW